MPAPIDKVIVTNLSRLTAKYKSGGVTDVKKAVRDLIAADAVRGLNTVLVDLSSKSAMKKHKGKPVAAAEAADPKANKDAIDRVFVALKPAYLVLLGAPDVIPHQDLKNPLFSDQDTDATAWSDLPYACDAPYSKSIRKFLAPTRVVGRLPDLANATDPTYLVAVLRIAAKYVQRPASDYDAFLGISTQTWKDSTDESLRSVFGAAAGMKVVPPDLPPWPTLALAARAHFVNCHGAPASHQFYGEPDFPASLDATQLPGELSDGTVMSAECCYGAELYDPALDGGQMGMCNTYVGNGAYGYFGSSTIAYGPPAGNDQADLICQDFLKYIRAGASAGRACLQARLDYVARAVVMKPVDLKTVAQFSLMGDPALTPVRPIQTAPHVMPKGVVTKAAGPRVLAAAAAAVGRVERTARRATLTEIAMSIVASTLVVADAVASAPTKSEKVLRELAAQFGVKAQSILSHSVVGGAVSNAKGTLIKAFAAGGATIPTTVHTLLERREPAGLVILIKGVEVVEYGGRYEAREFASR